ncbi:nuclear body protein SP140-like protein isoform X3 [Xenopus laevis]|uniref:Nuclear body protein SP140-like protein isoform X3 n=1 Tax=Xenopus laevis TaxID=8355 RepID=A0A8J1KRI9_XENLA|nr:nuclear body protein SP140-like protein isoform X3 [Xenopus laevis]
MVRFYSLNCRGLNSPNKRNQLLHDACKSNTDVLFCHETHFCKSAPPKFHNKRFPHNFHAYSSNKSKGVSILISSRTPFVFKDMHADPAVKLATSDVVPVQYTLPVSCGDFEGTLHVNRFGQGNCGKCIRTSNRWCTPLQFLALSGVPDSNTWDAQICVRGEPLNTLLQKKLLSLHDAGCCCDICTDCDSSQQNDDECSVCGDGGDLLCCEECPRAFHSNCHEPSTTAMESFSEPWICTFCKMQQMRKHSEPQQLLSCQYFLLHVLCDPNNELSIIQSKPKELDLLKKRLHEMEGGSGECPWNFISDVILTVIGAYPPQKREKVRGLLEKEFNQLMLS